MGKKHENTKYLSLADNDSNNYQNDYHNHYQNKNHPDSNTPALHSEGRVSCLRIIFLFRQQLACNRLLGWFFAFHMQAIHWLFEKLS